MRQLLNKTLALIALISLMTLAAPGAAAAEPQEVVKSTLLTQVLDILNNPAYADPAQRQRRHLAKQIVDRHFDYREMAKRSLGPTWNNLSNAQRDEFVSLFAELLEASYSDKIERYAKHVRIDYTGQSLDDGLRRGAHRGGAAQ